jgi:C_GCAxxG_C_C family probable redox protein
VDRDLDVIAKKGGQMSIKRDRAVSKFSEGYNCAQSVLYSFFEEAGMDGDMAMKVAHGFGAGMGRKQEVCGAVTGGIMAIGAMCGRGLHDEPLSREMTYSKVRELMDRFSDKHGAILCSKLLKDCDLATSDGQTFFRENDLKNKACKSYVESVVEILEDIMYS